MPKSSMLIGAIVMLVLAVALLAWHLRPTPAAGVGLSAELICLSCNQVSPTTWDKVITTGRNDQGLRPGWYVSCPKCGKPALAHNPGDPMPGWYEQRKRTPSEGR